MITNEMKAAAAMTLLKLKGQPCFRPGNCLASLGPVSPLPRVHVESGRCLTFILIHTSVAGKVRFLAVGNKSILIG
jgi:hypothetical protein